MINARHTRHPELVSASIPPHAPAARAAEWMLKQVQGDERAISLEGSVV
ncbi:MAG: hypothetical protein GW858_09540 [Sphingomonadales bacterium]|nr:hypothetical protein [Sphingomonadales bacterium]